MNALARFNKNISTMYCIIQSNARIFVPLIKKRTFNHQ